MAQIFIICLGIFFWQKPLFFFEVDKIKQYSQKTNPPRWIYYSFLFITQRKMFLTFAYALVFLKMNIYFLKNDVKYKGIR